VLILMMLQSNIMIINYLAMLHVLLWRHFFTWLTNNCYMPQLIDSTYLLGTIPVIRYTCILQRRVQRHLLVELVGKHMSLMVIVVVRRIFIRV
jgi:hypothetical protein